MKRRDFIHRTACAVGAAWIHPGAFAQPGLPLPSLPRKFSASDSVTLGKTGIQTSRLAIGTGTVGVGHHSHQTALGIRGLSDLLLNGYDHGLRFFDSADSYGSHPHVADALKHVIKDMRHDQLRIMSPTECMAVGYVYNAADPETWPIKSRL